MNGTTHSYDQKNQLKTLTGLDASGNLASVSYQYDATGRRIAKTVNATTTTLYAYDGWNVVEEYEGGTGVSPVLSKIHTWGLDLSGTAQGAGGVGGLLFTEDVTTNTAWHHHYDGNGNVTHLTNASGQTVATYTYDAFGNTVTATGTAAAANKYRFSTKPIDETIASTPLYYYGYRFYNPLTGRWINRDPIEEKGGLNLYGFVRNNGVGEWDVLGNNPFSGGSTNWLKSGSSTCCRKAVGRSGLGVVLLWNFNIWRNYDKYIACLDSAMDKFSACFCDCINSGSEADYCESKCNKEYYNAVMRCAANVSVGDID